MAEGQWYWCLNHQAVEPYQGCREDVRLGPYATFDEAQSALAKVKQRNEDWDNDPDWNDPEDDADDPVT